MAVTKALTAVADTAIASAWISCCAMLPPRTAELPDLDAPALAAVWR